MNLSIIVSFLLRILLTILVFNQSVSLDTENGYWKKIIMGKVMFSAVRDCLEHFPISINQETTQQSFLSGICNSGIAKKSTVKLEAQLMKRSEGTKVELLPK